MSSEMKLTPTFSFVLSPHSLYHHSSTSLTLTCAFFLGVVDENIEATVGVTSTSIFLLHSEPLVYTYCCILPSGRHGLHFMPLNVHTQHTHLSLSSTLPTNSSSSLQRWLKSWMYWHVCFHHLAICEKDRGECTDLLRRKGPSQP